MTTPAERVEQVERARQRWNAGDLPGYLELYAEDLQFHGVEPNPMDKTSVAGFYQQFWSAMGAPGRPDPQLDFYEHLVDGDLYSCRFAVSGQHRGDFMGVPATGRLYVFQGITIMRFRGDQVVERWTTADFLGLMVQLGAVPAPA
ncbi:ester cyclase [Geodermatophilus poikilotrophus]|uniref:SnoaL-like polyketide cyclase n=1 Tax=Geodermatophilus poikilotrophus TaxID=1333667 RepID=A0A1I0BQH6_9ACTN|nr:ester cyclase [Geodermatophilus poikilotrophus]SET09305.1 SnoaL-like polyketide cyclase [Geodermatophilus poikilotrophus]